MNFPDVADGDLRVGFGPRMVAAGWFAATALIPIVFFLVIFGQGIWSRSSYSDEGTAISFYVLLPICMAAFFGFTIGSRILDQRRVNTGYGAALLGMLVAVASYIAMMTGYLVIQILNDVPRLTADPSAVLNLALSVAFIAFIGAILLGWLIVIAGGIGGCLLFQVTRSTRTTQAQR